MKYGQLIETFRVSDREKQTQAGKPAATWFEKLVLHELFPNRHRLERLLWPAWLMQQLGLDWLIEKTGLLRLLPLPLQRMQRMLPRLRKNEPNLPREIRHLGPVRRARVGLFLGCVSDAMFRHVHWATVRVLQHAGCDVLVPDRQQCCGALNSTRDNGRLQPSVRSEIFPLSRSSNWMPSWSTWRDVVPC